MTEETHHHQDETAAVSAPLGFGRAPRPDPVEAAIARHLGTRQDLAHAAAAMNAADLASRQVEAEADAAFSAASAADGAAWADLLATRPDGLAGAVRLLRYVSASPASEVVEDPQDLLRQLAAVVEAAEAGTPAGGEPSANLQKVAGGPDPVFATIEAHRAAFAEWDRLSDARDALVPNAPGYAEAAAATDGPFEREVATFEALFSARPTTLPGAKAQAEYLVEAIRRTRIDAETADSERGLRTVSEALGRLVEPGTDDGAEPMDWYDAPAGFMASPAIQPFSFVRIPDGVSIELDRLRGIALAEFERRREAGTTGERLEHLRRELHLDILSKAVRGEGSFDVPLSGSRDWQAWAAEHPGMVPFPAHAPSALVALDLAIRGEAERLLALAEAEIERRRQDYAGYPDPAVWLRVERSLRREMRMEALAAVASDLPDDEGALDPALAAIAASRRAEAEMAAFGESATGHLTPEMRAQEDALSEAQEATRATAWATVPTTRAGRLALVEYARFQVELFRAADGEVDNPEHLLAVILDALEAAIRAEQPGEAGVSAAVPAERCPSNLDAFALVSAIEAEWTVWKALDAAPKNDPASEDSRARRDDLLDAAAALPATTREARHAKALALAWIHYVGEWRRGHRYEDYSLDGRLALDIDAAFRAGPTAAHPDAALLALGPTIAALVTAQDTVPAAEEEAYAKIDGLVMAETRRLAEMPARTLDGLILKAHWIERGADEELKDGIVADLLAMRGGT